MKDFNVFLLVAIVQEHLENKIQSDYPNVSKVTLRPTIAPSDGSFFDTTTGVTDPKNYVKFIIASYRLDIEKKDGTSHIYYIYFRNKVQHNDRSYTVPSSIEFGEVDGNKKYTQLSKIHYTDIPSWEKDNTRENRKTFIKDLCQTFLQALKANALDANLQ